MAAVGQTGRAYYANRRALVGVGGSIDAYASSAEEGGDPGTFVFALAHSGQWLAAATSAALIGGSGGGAGASLGPSTDSRLCPLKLYDATTMTAVRDLGAECLSDPDFRLYEVHFYHSNPDLLFGCCMDGTVRSWDARSPDPVQVITVPGTGPLFSASSSADDLVIATGRAEKSGDGASVRGWDARSSQALFYYDRFHTDEISQVRFHPAAERSRLLLTGSVDSTVCLFDTTISDPDTASIGGWALDGGDGVGHVVFAGPDLDGVAIGSTTERMSLWSLDGSRLSPESMGDESRARCVTADFAADYFLPARYDPVSNEILLVAASNSGNLRLFAYDVTPVDMAAQAQLLDTQQLGEGEIPTPPPI